MKITRIRKLVACGIFKDFSWDKDLPAFGKRNLIYGWNGSGKTTLSSLFHSLQQKTEPEATDVRLELEGNREWRWGVSNNPQLPALRVFNRDFISRSFFEDVGQQLEPVYYVGAESVAQQQELQKLIETKKALETKLELSKKAIAVAEKAVTTFATEHARSIRTLLLGDPAYANYEAPRFKSGIAQLETLDETPRSLSSDEREELNQFRVGRVLPDLDVPKTPKTPLTELSERISKVVKQTVISRKIASLESDIDLAAWVEDGTRLHQHSADQKCKFCEGVLSPERLRALEDHFSEDFRLHQGEIRRLINEVKSIRGAVDDVSLPQASVLYPTLRTRYEKAMQAVTSQKGLLSTYLEALEKALERKLAEPFRSFDLLTLLGSMEDTAPASVLVKILDVVMTGFASWASVLVIQNFNSACALIEEHNRLSATAGIRSKQAASDIETDELVLALPEWKRLNLELSQSNNVFKTSRLQDDEIGNQIRTLQNSIRQHAPAAQELTYELASYLGRKELEFVAVENGGYNLLRSGRPATGLSEGERTAIAFMYFLKSLQDSRVFLEDTVVVIDDPISSLDAGSLFAAFGYMRARTAKAAQLIVLTHNFSFFRQVKNWLNHAGGIREKEYDPKKSKDSHFYMLTTSQAVDGRTAKLQLIDPLLHRFESEYHYLFWRVLQESQKQTPVDLEHAYGLPNIARRLIEAFLAFRFPAETGKLQAQFDLMSGDAAVKAKVLRFLHTHSHSDRLSEPEHDLTFLLEAPAILKSTLDLMRENDPSHIDAMTKLAGRT